MTTDNRTNEQLADRLRQFAELGGFEEEKK